MRLLATVIGAGLAVALCAALLGEKPLPDPGPSEAEANSEQPGIDPRMTRVGEDVSSPSAVPADEERNADPEEARGRGDRRLVTGLAVDEEGRSVAGARVTLRTRPDAATLHSDGILFREPVPDAAQTTTDLLGAFELDLPPIPARIEAVAPGLALRSPVDVVTSAARRTAEVRLVLVPAGVLSGRIHDGAGNPIADAVVTAVEEGPFGQPLRTPLAALARSAADGRFALAGLPRGRAWRVVTWATGWARRVEPRPLAIEDEATLDVELAPAVRLCGRVVAAESERPIAGATVVVAVASFPAGSGTSTGTARTTAEGEFEITDLAPGRVTLAHVRSEGWGETVVTDAGDLREGDSLGLVLRLPRGGRVTGRVRGGDVRGLHVVMRTGWAPLVGEARAEVGGDGEFGFDGVPRGAELEFLAVREATPAGGPVVLTLPRAAGEAEVELLVGDAPLLAGIVLAPDGTPCVAQVVAVTRRGFVHRTWSDAEGRWSITDAAGTEDVVLQAVGRDGAARSPTSDRVLRLRAFLEGRGVVEDTDGNALPEARVTFRPVDATAPLRTRVSEADERGRFTFAGLAPDLTAIDVVVDGRALLRGWTPGDLRPGELLRVVVGREVEVRGRVCDTSGTPVVGALVVAGAQPGPPDENVRLDLLRGVPAAGRVRRQFARTAADGTYRVPCVLSDTTCVAVLAAGTLSNWLEGDHAAVRRGIRPGEVVDFRLGAGDAPP